MFPSDSTQLIDYQGSLFRRFTGKEKDSESGYYYFGARYFMPNLSIWNSVDPMADKYPSLSPYNYCAWNPMKLVDPMGDTCKFASQEDEEYVKQLLDKNSSVYSPAFAEKYEELDAASHNYYFESWDYDETRSGSGLFSPNTDYNTSTINFTKGENSETTNPYIGASIFRNLFEETYHAWDFEKNNHKQHRQTCLTEAKAWKFSTYAPGTKHWTFSNNINERQLTIMGRINHETNPLTIAYMLKFGFPATENSVGYKRGLYKHLPLCSKKEFVLYDGIHALPR